MHRIDCVYLYTCKVWTLWRNDPVELRHLRYFTTVAAEGSFSRAAEKLHIAQPPLSRQVQQLEDELGVRLLDRGRPLTLTEPGRYLFEQGRQILQRIDEMRAMTKRIAKGHGAAVQHRLRRLDLIRRVAGVDSPLPDYRTRRRGQ